MELFFDEKNQLGVKNINRTHTIKDFLTANQKFLQQHPLSCFECENNCCLCGWDIELDHVFVNRYQKKTGLPKSEIYKKYIKLNRLKKPVFAAETCEFLHSSGFCEIYAIRPFICRGFTCYDENASYTLLQNIILRILNNILKIQLLSFKKEISYFRAAEKMGFDVFREVPYANVNYDINIYQQIDLFSSYITEYEHKKLKKILE